MRPVLASVFSLTALLLSSSVAHSRVTSGSDEAATAIVPYGDLDLSSRFGLQTLNGRVHRAVSQVCSDTSKKSLEEMVQERRCLDSTLRKSKIDVQRAAEEYAARASGTDKRAASRS